LRYGAQSRQSLQPFHAAFYVHHVGMDLKTEFRKRLLHFGPKKIDLRRQGLCVEPTGNDDH
jgi:hypothetical protein